MAESAGSHSHHLLATIRTRMAMVLCRSRRVGCCVHARRGEGSAELQATAPPRRTSSAYARGLAILFSQGLDGALMVVMGGLRQDKEVLHHACVFMREDVAVEDGLSSPIL